MKKYLGCIMLLASCSGNEIVSDYQPFVQPDNFPTATYDFTGEDVKDEEAVFNLGKELFYEAKLSSDNTIACAECHNQEFAFTHHGHTLSAGVHEGVGIRNAQPIQNLAFMDAFTWDGGAQQLWQQPIIPITTVVEMNSSFDEIIPKLNIDSKYINLFKKAFKSGNIEEATILKALGNFMGLMVSNNSKYDKYLREEEGGELTDQELNGLLLFEDKGCITCHSGILFTDQSYRNNGLKSVYYLPNEIGRQGISQTTNDTREEDYFKFKVPSLRNIEKTAPYMHDGRISSLRGVLDHYDYKIDETTTNLDPILINGIPLTEEEKDDIIAFLNTLTDNEFLNDDRFIVPGFEFDQF